MPEAIKPDETAHHITIDAGIGTHNIKYDKLLTRLGSLSTTAQRVWLIIACAVLFCVWTSRTPFTEIDEVRYAEATREMLHFRANTIDAASQQRMLTHANGLAERLHGWFPTLNQQNASRSIQRAYPYIIPYFNFLPRYQKPVLYYWIQSLSVRLLGVNEFAARLPSGLLALTLVLCFHAFLLHWLTRHATEVQQTQARGAAFLGTLLLAIMPVIAVWAHASTTDITLTTFISLAMLALAKAATTEYGPTTIRQVGWWYRLAAVAIGLAFLTKGPMGAAIPVLGWLIYHLLQRSVRLEARRVPWISSILLFLLMTVPWYLATYLVDGPGFLTHFFIAENITRYTSVTEGHGTDNRFVALLIYLASNLLIFFPASILVIRELLHPFAGNKVLQSDLALCRLRRFALAWAIAVIGLFATSKTQLPSYVQSAAPALAIIAALHIYSRLSNHQQSPAPLSGLARYAQPVETWLFAVLGLVLVAGPIVALLLPTLISGPLGAAPLSPTAKYLAIGLLLLVGIPFLFGSLLAAAKQRSTQFILWAIAGWSGVLLVLLLAVLPLTVHKQYDNSLVVARYLTTLPGDEPIVSYRKMMKTSEDLVYYSQRHIDIYYAGVHVDFRNEFRRLLADHASVIFITDRKGLSIMRSLGDVTELKTLGDCHIIRVIHPRNIY